MLNEVPGHGTLRGGGPCPHLESDMAVAIFRYSSSPLGLTISALPSESPYVYREMPMTVPPTSFLTSQQWCLASLGPRYSLICGAQLPRPLRHFPFGQTLPLLGTDLCSSATV